MPRRAARGIRDSLMWVLLVLLAFLLSAFYHLNLPLGRGIAAKTLTTWVSSQMLGTLHIGQIEHVGLEEIRLRDAELLDPNGATVIRGRQISLAIDYAAILDGKLRFSHARLREGELILIENEEGSPTFLDAFSPSDPTPSMGDPFHAIVDDLSLEGVTVRGDILGLEGLRIEGANAHGRMVFHETTEIYIDSLTGDVVAPFPRPARIEDVQATIFGDARGTSVTARASMGDEHVSASLGYAPPEDDPEGESELDLRVRADPVRGETLAELGFDWASILTGESTGDVRLHGPPDALRVQGTLVTAGGEVEIDGSLPSDDDVVVTIDTPNVALDRVLSGAPELTVAGRVVIRVPNDESGETQFEADLQPFRYEGFDIPEVHAHATMLPDGSVRVDQATTALGGGRTSVEGNVDPDGRLTLRVRGFIPQVANEPNIATLVPGLRASARYDLDLRSDAGEPVRYDIAGDVTLGSVRYGSITATRIPVSGRVFGDLAAPSLDLRVKPSGVVASGVPLGGGTATIVGGPRSYALEGTIANGRARTMTFEMEASNDPDGIRIEIPTFDVRVGGTTATGTTQGLLLASSGRIDLGRTQLTIGSGTAVVRGTYQPRGNDNIDIVLTNTTLPGLLRLADVELDADGRLDLTVQLRGDLDRAPSFAISGSLEGGRWGTVSDIHVDDLTMQYEPGAVTGSGQLRIGDRGALGMSLSGTPDPTNPDPIEALQGSTYEITLRPDALDLALLPELFPEQELPEITGALSGTATLGGTMDFPTASAEFEIPALGIPDWQPLAVTGAIRYDDSNLLSTRVRVDDAEGELAEVETQLMLSLRPLITGELNPSDVLQIAPWQVALRIPPRTLDSLPESFRTDLPEGHENVQIATVATFSGGGGWPLHGQLNGTLDWLGDMSDALCAVQSHPRSNIVGTIEGDDVRLEVDSLLGTRRVMSAVATGELDLLAWMNGDSLSVPEITVSGRIRGAEMESLPMACRYFAGPLDGEIDMRLFGDEPHVRIALDASEMQARALARGIRGSGLFVRETPAADVQLLFEADAERATASLQGAWWNGGESSISASMPLSWEGEPALPTIAEDAAIEGAARFLRTPLSGLLVWLSDMAGVEGILDGEIALSGDIEAPMAHGRLSIEEGRVELRSVGQRLRDVYGTLVFDGSTVELETLHARDGDGEVLVSGELEMDGLAPGQLRRLRMDADDFPVRQEGSVMAELNGRATLSGCFCSNTRACMYGGVEDVCDIDTFFGDLTIDRLDVQLPDDGTRSAIALQSHPDVYIVGEERDDEATSEVDQVWYIAVDASNRFWVRSVEQDFAAQVSARIDLTIADDEFKIRGESRIHRANFSVFGKTFRVESGSMIFRNSAEIDPIVSLVAVHELRNQPGETVQVEVSGTLSYPEVRFTTSVEGVSDQGEIIALLLTGDTRIGRSQQSPDSNPQGAAAEATDFLAGVAFGIATLALREQFGELIPTIRIEMGNDGFRSPIIRAGINVDSLIPERLRDVVRGVYIEGYFTARRSDGTEDSTRQAHDNGFLIELQFPRNIVGTSDYAPPNNWSLDFTWEP